MARVPYRDPEDLPERSRHLLFSPGDEAPAVNVFRAIANNPAVLDSFRKYFGVLWTEAGLTVRERQLAILATAAATRSAYMWHQHVRLSREAGLTDEEIRAVAEGDHGAFEARERRLLATAGAVAERAVDDDRLETFVDGADPERAVGLVMLVAGYVGLARALAALDVEVEDAFVGWAPEG